MNKLITWLNARPLIKIRELERACGIPQAALAKALNGDIKYLSDKHLPALKAALKPYGFK